MSDPILERFPERFRACLGRASFDPLLESYASDATLEALLPGGRVVHHGPEAIGAALASWWPEPSALVEWTATSYARGVEIRFERADATAECARHQTHHLHIEGDRIARQVVVPRRPRTGLASPSAPVGSLLANAVEREPLLHDGVSGSLLERIVLGDGTRLVVKHLSRDRDWIARATDDPGREALLEVDGVFADLPDGIDPAVVAVEPADDGWRLYLRDLTSILVPRGARVSREENRRMLGLVAEIHRAFMGLSVPHLATAEAHIVFLTPATAARESGCEVFLRVIERGAELLPSLVDADLVDALHAIVADPTPLADELRSCGTTLAHGDVRYPNIGLVPEGIVLIDWGLATLAPPALDLAFFLSSGLSDVDVTREQAIEDIRAIWADLVDDRAFGLGLLAEAVGTIWFEAMRIVDHADERERARSADELEWWSARARDGLERYWSPV